MDTMSIATLEVGGLSSVLEALRLPFGLPARSICRTTLLHDEGTSDGVLSDSCRVAINEKDLSLMKTLVKRGDEHAKVIRGIMVYAKITAPIYWWRELETYRAGHERLSSESTMHIDCRGLGGEELQKAKASIPMGHPCTCVDVYSYQCLRNICRQREGHRLPEWEFFIDWVHTLPLAEELIFTK